MREKQHCIRFVSACPYDHLGRALDALRQMGFVLKELRLSVRDGVAEIVLSFASNGHHAVDALLRRLACLVGVTRLETQPTENGSRGEEGAWNTFDVAQV